MALLALGFSATVLLATVSPAHSHCKLAEPAEFTPRSVLA
jgi:hypothetical protein